MKKHYFYNMLTILMVTLTSFSFASCGGDDDDEQGGGSGGQNVLVGSWRQSWNKDTDNASGYNTFTFNADGTGTEVGKNQSYDRNGKASGSPTTWNDSFRYELYEYDTYLKTGSFGIRYTGDSKFNIVTFELNGNKLIMWSGTYTKQ